MSLRVYRSQRLVILRPGTSVLEAARALESNQVGAVVVQHEGRVTGIATDRDLAVRVLGQGRDPRTTTLGDVMTPDVATLPIDASRTDAIELMRERRIRRLPLLEDGRIAGMVTLDDLLADEAASLSDLGEVIRAQIGDGGPPTRLQVLAERRRASRLESSYRRLMNELRTDAALPSVEQADTAAMVVLSALVRRLTPGEAKDLIAQLPLKLGERLERVVPGPDKFISADSIRADLARKLDVSLSRADEVLRAVARLLDANVSAGEMEEVRHQLPKDLREVFTPELSQA